ncbi:hypothetical protein HS5_08510 [Acidianus sp. HS-5]|nr:hypothetical protein HS5_08510 [Acidianus sp. HS-5]
MGGFINSIIQIVGIILIYIYTVSNNFNFESMLWGIALIIALIFNMIPSFYRGNYLQMATGIGYSIAVLLFTIGMIITGASQVSAPSPSSLGISGGIINGAYGTYIAAGAIGIIAGIIGLIDSIFILIYTLAYKAMPNL